MILRVAGIALGVVVALALVVVGYVALTKRVAQKYALEPSQLPAENLWFFRLDPRPTG